MHLTFKTKKNGPEFLTFYIRPRSAVDSAQWDWGTVTNLHESDPLIYVITSFLITNLQVSDHSINTYTDSSPDNSPGDSNMSRVWLYHEFFQYNNIYSHLWFNWLNQWILNSAKLQVAIMRQELLLRENHMLDRCMRKDSSSCDPSRITRDRRVIRLGAQLEESFLIHLSSIWV